MSQTNAVQEYDRALQLHRAGRAAEAEAICRRALARNPSDPTALHLLGIFAFEAGRTSEGVDLVRRAVAIDPHFAMALTNLANMCNRVGQYRDGETFARRAVALRPDFPAAHNNLGMAIVSQGRIAEGLPHFQQAVAVDSRYTAALNNLSAAYGVLGQLDEAIATGRQALQLEPTLRSALDNIIFLMLSHPRSDAREIRAEMDRWWSTFGAPLSGPKSYPNSRDPKRRLKIGYVSHDPGHVVSFNLQPLWRNHNREQFDITFYSMVPCEGKTGQTLAAFAGRVRDISATSDEAAAKVVYQDQIDILMDLSLHTQGNRLPLFAMQPAPVQISFAGYPASAGLKTIQYRLTDRHLEPPDAALDIWTDKPIYLPHSFWCYQPAEDEVDVNPLPALDRGSVTFGCLNALRKVNADCLHLWAPVMKAVPGSRLTLLAPKGEHRARTQNALASDGITSERIEWVEPAERKAYLKLYHRIDLGLDTFPYNGHTTSLDAMWMGVPIITLEGASAVARAGVSQLSNVGLTELIARNAGEFVRIAADWATNLTRLAELRASLRERMKASPICDAIGFARGVEKAYRIAWREWCAKGSRAVGSAQAED